MNKFAISLIGAAAGLVVGLACASAYHRAKKRLEQLEQLELEELEELEETTIPMGWKVYTNEEITS